MAEAIAVPVWNRKRETAGELALPPAVFGGPVRRHLLYEAVKMQMANRRRGTASTKTRGEVRGGGRKPWRQKGTGRARAGSVRSPLWVGGGTVFGPKPRDYSYQMPKSARRAALCSALALKVRQKQVVVLDRLEIDPPKTKVVAALLADFGIHKALFLTEQRNEVLERAARNLPYAKVLPVAAANVRDILRYDHLILTPEVVRALEQRVAA